MSRPSATTEPKRWQSWRRGFDSSCGRPARMSGKPRRSDSSESAGQDNLFSHLEPQRLDYLLNALNAGAGVLGCFVTLDLLLLQPEPLGQLLLAQAQSYSGLDQGSRQLGKGG